MAKKTKTARKTARRPNGTILPKAKGRKAATAKAAPAAQRAGSKQGALIEMLKRKDGASIEELAKKFGWQPHTVRGAIAGALKKKLGLPVLAEKVEGRGTVYSLAA